MFFDDLIEINEGLSKKKIYRKIEKNIKKIIIDFSQNKKEIKNFLNVYEILNKVNISIPIIYEVHLNKNIIVMEDFGHKNFSKLINENNLYDFLKISVDNLIIIQNSLINEDLSNLKKYSYRNFEKDLSEFINFYLPYKKISEFPIKKFYKSWKEIYQDKKLKFESFNHKDFEFVNLIFLNTAKQHFKCGIIDFQDAFLGFIGWDLFSVLENPRINVSTKHNYDLIKYFYANVTINLEFDVFLNQYYLLNLARHTRIIGRWAKLIKSDNSPEYLNYLDTTKKRIISCLKKIQNDELTSIYNIVFKDDA